MLLKQDLLKYYTSGYIQTFSDINEKQVPLETNVIDLLQSIFMKYYKHNNCSIDYLKL